MDEVVSYATLLNRHAQLAMNYAMIRQRGPFEALAAVIRQDVTLATLNGENVDPERWNMFLLDCEKCLLDREARLPIPPWT